MTQSKSKEVFQVDSEIVNKQRSEDSNYIVEINRSSPNKDLCVIYFSSHHIYYPNTEDCFRKSILNKNYYEWRSNPPISAYKQIFVRDIFKQWYLHGISSQITSPTQLLKILKEETQGYRVITIGSSAGGYAAILYGSLLNVNKIFAFNSQFEINSLLSSSNEYTNPILFREKENLNLRQYFDIVPLIGQVPIYYFYSIYSEWDAHQKEHIGNHSKINSIGFKTSHHGIPFPRAALSYIFNLQGDKLNALRDKTYNPIVFSIKIAGFWKTFKGILSQSISIVKRKLSNAFSLL